MVNFAHAFVVGSVLQSTFELYLRLRRARKLREPDVPRELKASAGVPHSIKKESHLLKSTPVLYNCQ